MSRTAQFVALSATVTNATTSYADVTGLSLNVTAGLKHRFKAVVPYACNATTTGSAWSVAGTGTASPTLLVIQSIWTLTATTNSYAVTNAADTITANASSASTSAANLATIEGVITPSVTGLITVRFISEVAVTAAIVAQVGSWFEVREMG